MTRDYESIEEEALDRISEYIDTTSRNYQKIRQQIAKKYPNWSQRQRTKFAMGLVEREIKLSKPIKIKEKIIEKRTTLTGSGFGAKRTVIIRDEKGRYAGKKENLKIYSRHGKVYFRNTKTGKKGKLG